MYRGIVALTVSVGTVVLPSTAAADRDAREARALAEREFPSMVGQASGSAFVLPHGLRLAEPVSETSARLETATGAPAGVAVFTEPVATKVDGELELLDLDLVARSGRLRSKRPGVDVRYPQRADGMVRLADAGVGFTAGAARAVSRLPDRNELFFADALPGHTDYALVPKADGVEALWQLRSSASPQTLRLRFDLPPGGRLKLVPRLPGAAQVVGADGTVLAVVEPPSAVDAHGTTLDVTTTAQRTTLSYRVAHRDRGLTYPILVDPVVGEYWDKSVAGEIGGGFVDCGAPGGKNSGGGAWTYGQSIPAGSTAFLPACDMRQFGWGYGLYVLQYANSPYVAGAIGLWQWVAPTDAYVSAVNWIGIGHRPGNLVAGNTTMFAAIGNIFTGFDNAIEWPAGTHQDLYLPTGPSHSRSQAAYTGLRVNVGGSRSIGAYSRLDGAVVYLNDDYNPTAALTGHTPTLGGTGPETPWFDPAQGAPTFRLRLADRGLGVWQYVIVRNDTGGYLSPLNRYPCVGTKVWKCPNSIDTGAQSYTSSAIPEGLTPSHAVVWDINERVGHSPSWNLRVDRTAPQIGLSGEAYVNRAGTDNPNAIVHAVATDGSNASNAAKRSGVKRLDITVDGALVRTTGVLACATGSCSIALDLPMTAVSIGSHTVRVTATDQLGHTSSASFTLVRKPDPYPTSTQYGGADRSVNTLAEATALGQVLATSPAVGTVWLGLAPRDQDYMLEIDEPYYDQWVVRVQPGAQTTYEELYDESLGFREENGLNTDPALIHAILLDPAYDESRRRFGVPLTAAEVATMMRRNGLARSASDTTSFTVVDGLPEVRDRGDSFVAASVTDEGGVEPAPPDAVDAYGAANAPDTYAGKFIEGDLLRVGFTGDAESHLAALRELAGPDVEVFQATYSKRALDATAAAVLADATVLEGLGIRLVSAGADYGDNRVWVSVEDATDAALTTLRARYGPSIELDAGVAETALSRRDYFKYVFAGLAIERPIPGTYYNAKCTLGFAFVTHDWLGVNTAKVALTAGHCGPKDAMWLQGGAQLGRMVRRHLCDNCRADAGLLKLVDERETEPRIWVNPWLTTTYNRVQRVGTLDRGNTVCVSGRSRRRAVCGKFLRYENVYVEDENDDGEKIVRWQRRLGHIIGPRRFVKPFCKGGDSGGPVYFDGSAIGIITAEGGRRHCWFTQLPYALESVGLDVDTIH